VKLELYSKGSDAPVATHYIKDDIQETGSGSFVQFKTLTDKRVTTNMDFIAFDEEDEK